MSDPKVGVRPTAAFEQKTRNASDQRTGPIMADEFEDRLKVAAERVRAEQQAAAAAQAQRARAQEARVAKATAAIQDWNNRIYPIIGQAITRTNQLMGETGIQLASMPMQPTGQLAPGHAASLPSLCISHKSVIDKMNSSHQMPQSPQRVGARVNAAQRRAAEAQRHAQRQTLDQAVRLDLGMNENAELAVSCRNYKVKVEPKKLLPASEFDEKAIKDLVAEFVSAGLLGIDNPPIPQRIGTEEPTQPTPPPSTQSFDAARDLIADLEPRAGNAALGGGICSGRY